jgi:hypothetical protein
MESARAWGCQSRGCRRACASAGVRAGNQAIHLDLEMFELMA